MFINRLSEKILNNYFDNLYDRTNIDDKQKYSLGNEDRFN